MWLRSIVALVVFAGVVGAAFALDPAWHSSGGAASLHVVRSLPHTDHSKLISGPFKDGPSVTRACLKCHPNSSHEVMQTSHWSWAGQQEVVVMSNDERQADEAWRRLAVQLNPGNFLTKGEGNRVYILAGGLNRWIDLYRDHKTDAPGPDVPVNGDDLCRHQFTAALGARGPIARPEANAVDRKFQSKVKVVSAKRAAGGGCG